MTSLGHVIVGAAVGKAAYSFAPAGLPVGEIEVMLLAVGISVLPDINMLWKKDFKKHHEDFTHYPLVILFSSMVLMVIEIIFSNYQGLFFSILWFACLGVHLLMDTFGNTVGIHWFWPFSKKEYSFTRLKKENIELPLSHRFKSGAKSKVLGFEFFFIALSIIYILLF